MTLSPDKIIRGAEVDGVMFCTPSGVDKTNPVTRQEKENLKALEDFWYEKGFGEGKKKGFDEGYAAGQEEGHRKGLQEGTDKGQEEGRAAGHEEGVEEGGEKVRAELSEMITLIETVSNDLNTKQESLYEEVKAELVVFTLAVCEQVLRTHLSDAEVLRSSIEKTIHQAQPIIKKSPVEVILNKQDLKILEDKGFKKTLAEKASEDPSAVTFVADEGMRSGDCRIETSLGLVNFDIHRILGDIEKKVLEVRADDDGAIEDLTESSSSSEEQEDNQKSAESASLEVRVDDNIAAEAPSGSVPVSIEEQSSSQQPSEEASPAGDT